jgi:hypothetical protein
MGSRNALQAMWLFTQPSHHLLIWSQVSSLSVFPESGAADKGIISAKSCLSILDLTTWGILTYK